MITSSLLLDIMSSIVGIDLQKLKKYIQKESDETDEQGLIESIDTISKQLESSRDALALALQGVEKQKKQFASLKEEAEVSQQIKSLNQSQVEALNSTLEKALLKQETRSSKKGILWNLFFCVLSAVLGFILGKLF